MLVSSGVQDQSKNVSTKYQSDTCANESAQEPWYAFCLPSVMLNVYVKSYTEVLNERLRIWG